MLKGLLYGFANIQKMSHSTLSDFEILGQIGKGSYGVVYKCKRKLDSRVYVLKEIRLAGATKKEIESAVSECHILARIDSDYVVRYFDSFVESETETLWMVMEYCGSGTLRNLITSTKTRFTEEECWYYICQILLGVASIHALKIIHRDIKSLNIFLAENSEPMKDKPYTKYLVKLGDMGVSKELQETQGLAQTLVGSPYYLSPEICRSEKYNQKSDIWALGVTFYELMNMGKHPFLAKNQASLIVKILKGKYEDLPDDCYSQALRDLVYWCLRMNATGRPDVFTLLALPIVKDKLKFFNLKTPKDIELSIQKAEESFTKAVQKKAASRGKLTSSGSATNISSKVPDAQVTTDIVDVTDASAKSSIRGRGSAQASVKMNSDSEVKSQCKKPKARSENTPAPQAHSISSRAQEPVYMEDFDNDGENNEMVESSSTRPETAICQQELEQLLAQDALLSTEQIEVYNRINSYGLENAVRDELVRFYSSDKANSETEISKFVFGRIGYDKVELTTHLRAHADILKKRKDINAKIVDLLGSVS